MSTAADIVVRRATVEDVALVLTFIQKLARYEKLEDRCVATEADLAKTLFGENPSGEVLLAFEGDAPAGFAVYFFSYSTFLGKRGLYLEDLFVEPERRGRGIAKRIFAELLRIARDRECGRFEWSVLNWNTPAIEFYEKLGAKAQREWILYRMEAQQISRLANEAPFT